MYLSEDLKTMGIPDEQFSLYKKLFAQGSFGVRGGFAIQPIGGKWSNPNRKIRDQDILDHLQQIKSIAAIPPYYPSFFTIDLDFPPVLFGTYPDNAEDRVSKIIDIFQLHDSEYHEFTSPSFGETGNRHVIVPATYRGKPASTRLIKTILSPIAAKVGVELFPYGLSKLRLPFGYKQCLIDREDGAPLPFSWTKNLYWLSQLDPVDLERYPFQHYQTSNSNAEFDLESSQSNAQYYWEHGLQAFGTRHKVTGILASYSYFRSWDQDTAKTEIKNWLRSMHNGFSKEIRKGNWKRVDAEVDVWVEKKYEYFENRAIYPNNIHNLQAWMTRADVDLVLKIFYGDWINQKRLCRLLQHFRGRTGGTRRWIPVHRDVWWRIVSSCYKKFQQSLEGKILEINNSYRAGMYSKRVILRVPNVAPSQMICDQEGRAMNDWKKILLSVFGNIPTAVQASGANFQRFYEEPGK